jgi:hypothetical protein
LYQNGTNVGSATQTGTIVDGAKAVLIGYETGQGSTTYWSGYISNTRIVKGTALYTANFTPATTNLTAVANTSLLTCHVNSFRDASTNNFTVTRNGDAKIVSFNPFNITNTGVDGSMYFDGTDDYVTAGSYTNFQFGTGDFTVEWWQYISGYNGSGAKIWQYASDGNFSGGGTGTDMTSISNLNFTTAGGANVLSQTVQPYQWNHIAIARASGTTRIFVNGAQTNSIADSTNYNYAGTYAFSIGGGRNGAGTYVNSTTGYISNFKLVKGTAVYTANFTPSTSSLTATTNTQLLTLQYDQPHNNHTFLDSSSNQFLITRSGNASQGTFSPFSQTGWSAYFPGSSKLVFGSSSAWTFGTGDWTVEHWMMLPTLPAGTISYIDMRQGGALTNHVVFQTYSTGGAGVYVDSSPTAFVAVQNLFTPGQWGHVAYVRESGVIKIYFNGTLVASVASSVNMPAATPSIGGEYQGTNYLTGYISNLRVSKSARYTANFTPGTSSLSSSGASVLTLNSNRFVDITGNTTISVNTGSPSVVAFSPFAPAAVYSPVAHGGSVYLDGTGDYLNTGSDVGFNLGVGNFTWEFWTYLTASPADGNILFQPRTPAGIDAVLFGYKSGSNFTIYATTDGGSSWNLFSNTVIIAVADVLNRWAHWAFTRNGNTYTVYVDGVSKVTGTSANQISQATNVFTLGATVSGYFSGFRFVKAQALSTGNFTPPTAPLTANTIGWTGANVATSLTGTVNLLLNFTDAAILDSTGRQVLETLADAKSSSVVTKFTGGSMSFDGTGDYLQSSAALSDLVFLHNGTPWTVEGWFYTGSTSAQYILSTDAASASIGMSIGLSDTNTRDIMAQIFRGVSGSWLLAISPTNSWSLNTWTHFAATFDSSKNLTVYINGVQVATASGSSFAFSSANPSYPLVVGRYQSPTPGGYFNGYISDLRVTRGYARYTGNFPTPTVSARLK